MQSNGVAGNGSDLTIQNGGDADGDGDGLEVPAKKAHCLSQRERDVVRIVGQYLNGLGLRLERIGPHYACTCCGI